MLNEATILLSDIIGIVVRSCQEAELPFLKASVHIIRHRLVKKCGLRSRKPVKKPFL